MYAALLSKKDGQKVGLFEPLDKLYKDEVRALGRMLGLDARIVGRHPFPGPGLGVRILGEVTKEKCDILREADSIFIEELRRRGLYDQIWQAFCVLCQYDRSASLAMSAHISMCSHFARFRAKMV